MLIPQVIFGLRCLGRIWQVLGLPTDCVLRHLSLLIFCVFFFSIGACVKGSIVCFEVSCIISN